jgi:DNA-binding NarL/FixJ family response regulator
VCRHGFSGDEIRVLIADDQDVFRAGLRAMLEHNGLEVVGEARDSDEALRLVTIVAPDVVLMSLDMPRTSGLAATRQMAAAAPHVQVVVLTATLEAGTVIDALVAGACAYLPRDESGEALAAGVVRMAAAGTPLLSPRTARALIERLREVSPQPWAADAIRAKLSDRELDVLRLMVAGNDNAAIAAALFISSETVKHHVSSVLHKLGVQNRVQAAVEAVRAGMA